MRITYIAQSTIPSRAANSIHVMKMCAALAAQGHEVDLMVPDSADTEPDVGDIHGFYGVPGRFAIRKLAYPKLRGRTLVSVLHAAWLLRHTKPDLLYSRALMLGGPAAMLTGQPLILERHAPVEPAYERYFARLIRHRAFRRLVVISEALRLHFLDRYPALEGRVLVAHDGADAPPVHLEPMPLARDGRLVAGYCGQLFKGKGVEVVVELARRLPEVDFHVVGGIEADIAAWKAEAGPLGNLFFHGFKPPGEAQCYVAGFDVALAPYQHNVTVYGSDMDIAQWMSPLKLFEYMALSRPIVSSDLPVLREVLRDGDNAVLCPPANLSVWEQSLRRMHDSALRERLGRHAARDFADTYSWDRRAGNVLAGLHLKVDR